MSNSCHGPVRDEIPAEKRLRKGNGPSRGVADIQVRWQCISKQVSGQEQNWGPSNGVFVYPAKKAGLLL